MWCTFCASLGGSILDLTIFKATVLLPRWSCPSSFARWHMAKPPFPSCGPVSYCRPSGSRTTSGGASACMDVVDIGGECRDSGAVVCNGARNYVDDPRDWPGCPATHLRWCLSAQSAKSRTAHSWTRIVKRHVAYQYGNGYRCTSLKLLQSCG
jgi:hypothetical protein